MGLFGGLGEVVQDHDALELIGVVGDMDGLTLAEERGEYSPEVEGLIVDVLAAGVKAAEDATSVKDSGD